MASCGRWLGSRAVPRAPHAFLGRKFCGDVELVLASGCGRRMELRGLLMSTLDHGLVFDAHALEQALGRDDRGMTAARDRGWLVKRIFPLCDILAVVVAFTIAH